MDDLELARTIEARIEEASDLARTIVQHPRATIEPGARVSSAGKAALQALAAVGASLEGKVSIHETLGEGGMGVVRLATQVTLGRHVALKTLRNDTASVDATLRILREAWVTGTLEHPNVVPIYDVGLDASGAPVILMKRIEGLHWGEIMRSPGEIKRRFSATDPLEWNLRVLASVCNAVHFAHSRGIVHRDLKPENVMIGSFGEVYVLDWGIAVSLREDPSGRLPSAASATDVAGTPVYMAPEMLLGDPAMLSERTDVYLLGAILYEVFTGQPPHRGDNLQALIAQVLLSAPGFPPGVPPEAQRICEKAMQRDPALRYESAEAFRVAVDEYLRHRGSRHLARDAERSLTSLLQTLADEPPGEERTLAAFNRLGECRFGYRAALEAWPANDAARSGLDRALLAMVHHELHEGDAHAEATLLREVAAPPADVRARVEAAIRARADQDRRLAKLEQDADPTVGGRTRTLIGAIFGVLWTVAPLVGWWWQGRGGTVTYPVMLCAPAAFVLLGLGFFAWARESLTKTRLNRRVSLTLGLHLSCELLLSVGTYLAGISPLHGQLLHMLTWCLSLTLVSVWVEPWFGLCAATDAASFLVACALPRLMYPLMAIDNLALTVLIAVVWLPHALQRRPGPAVSSVRGKRAWLVERDPGEVR